MNRPVLFARSFPLSCARACAVLALLLAPACTDAAAPSKSDAVAPAIDATCEHGVARAICGRCLPALKPAFAAKNDWCEEHSRPESQCVPCHPNLAKDGIK